MSKQRPSIERLREVLAYAPETGKLTWRIRVSNRIEVGDEAGHPQRGYIYVRIDGVLLPAHCVIFAVVTGRWPEPEVDHEDRCRSNNRWSNLREANESQNRTNSSRPNLTGFKGVNRSRNGKAFEAKIKFKGRWICLGTHPTAQQAHTAYMAKAKELYGEFARAA